ncbi:5'-nucleotidase C-terminal domain-containing protein [Alteromonadaceae bacterium BrNp21-10]|nr:5'-nucleotidase C-terminal domain-containing protein [Alteromonadaceae bacterium BrNp21-10]
MKLINNILILGVTSSLLLVSGCSDDNDSSPVPVNPPVTESPKAVDITILHTNDHHSYLEGQTYDLKIDHDENVDGIEDIRLNLGGFSRIASAISEYRDENTLVLNSGELNGTLYFSLYKGEVDIKVFNYLDLDAYQLGNHEFDEGEARLVELIEMANFPILGGNVQPTSDSPLFNSNIEPYVIKEINGEKIAILGVLKVEKTRESSMVTDAVEFIDEIESVKTHVADLTAQGVNKIILLSHVGYDFDQVIAEQVTGVDIIVGGDTHNALDSTGELAQLGVNVTGEYPTIVNNPDNEPVYIVQAWEYAKGLGRLNISFDANGKVTDIDGNLELLVGQPYQVKDESGSWVNATPQKITDISTAISNIASIREIEGDVAVNDIIQPYKESLAEYQKVELGTVTQTMPFTRIPTDFIAGQQPSGSYAAQVVADAFLTYLPKADVSIQNAGGVRSEFTSGVFTVADAYTILPFSNTVVTIDMTGAQIIKVLNEGLTYSQGISGSTGSFPYSSHLRYDVLLGAAEQQGIVNVEVKDRGTNEWSDIDINATYSVATNSFTAQGKDGYVTFAEVREANSAAFEESDVVYVVPLIELFRDELENNILPTLNTDEYCLKSVTTLL